MTPGVDANAVSTPASYLVRPQYGPVYGMRAKEGPMPKYRCDDGNAEIEIEADSPKDAAQEYVNGGEWGDIDQTTWITVYVRWTDEYGDAVQDRVKVAIHPDEPECPEGDHDWMQLAVRGSGGGVIVTFQCKHKHCGRLYEYNSWAQDPADGEQGLTSTRYFQE